MLPFTTGVNTKSWYSWVVVPNPTELYLIETEILGYLKYWYPVPILSIVS